VSLSSSITVIGMRCGRASGVSPRSPGRWTGAFFFSDARTTGKVGGRRRPHRRDHPSGIFGAVINLTDRLGHIHGQPVGPPVRRGRYGSWTTCTVVGGSGNGCEPRGAFRHG
jgi:hypothetical protein